MKKKPTKAAKKRTYERPYNYDTKIGVIEKKYKIKLNVPPDTKLGDYYKSKKGFESFVRFLQV